MRFVFKSTSVLNLTTLVAPNLNGTVISKFADLISYFHYNSLSLPSDWEPYVPKHQPSETRPRPFESKSLLHLHSVIEWASVFFQACQYSMDPNLLAALLYFGKASVVNERRTDGFTPLHLVCFSAQFFSCFLEWGMSMAALVPDVACCVFIPNNYFSIRFHQM